MSNTGSASRPFFAISSNFDAFLVEAVMSENNFSGSIPFEITNLSELRKSAATVDPFGVAQEEIFVFLT